MMAELPGRIEGLAASLFARSKQQESWDLACGEDMLQILQDYSRERDALFQGQAGESSVDKEVIHHLMSAFKDQVRVSKPRAMHELQTRGLNPLIIVMTRMLMELLRANHFIGSAQDDHQTESSAKLVALQRDLAEMRYTTHSMLMTMQNNDAKSRDTAHKQQQEIMEAVQAYKKSTSWFSSGSDPFQRVVHIKLPNKADDQISKFEPQNAMLDTGSARNWRRKDIVAKSARLEDRLKVPEDPGRLFFRAFQGTGFFAIGEVEIEWMVPNGHLRQDLFLVSDTGPFEVLIGRETLVAKGQTLGDWEELVLGLAGADIVKSEEPTEEQLQEIIANNELSRQQQRVARAALADKRKEERLQRRQRMKLLATTSRQSDEQLEALGALFAPNLSRQTSLGIGQSGKYANRPEGQTSEAATAEAGALATSHLREHILSDGGSASALAVHGAMENGDISIEGKRSALKSENENSEISINREVSEGGITFTRGTEQGDIG